MHVQFCSKTLINTRNKDKGSKSSKRNVTTLRLKPIIFIFCFPMLNESIIFIAVPIIYAIQLLEIMFKLADKLCEK